MNQNGYTYLKVNNIYVKIFIFNQIKQDYIRIILFIK